MNNTGTCKYCKHNILWIDRKPFESDGETRHTYDVCSQKRIAGKSKKRKEALLAKKAGFEKIHADHPIGSYVVYYSKGYCEDRFVPLGVVVSHQKFRPKTAPLVVKAVGHGEYEEESWGGIIVSKERYEETIRAEIKRHTADLLNGSAHLEPVIYKLSHYLGSGKPRELLPEEFFLKVRLDTAKRLLEAKNIPCQTASQS